MNLAVFNGSPRFLKSNTKILIEKFLTGYNQVCSSTNSISVQYLANRKYVQEYVRLYKNSEVILIFFPLYTDCMPGIVMDFFERIVDVEDSVPKKVGFVVQSGFPESVHSEFVAAYLENLCKKLGVRYFGTVIKGGVEGIQMMPKFMTRKLYSQFTALGKHFAVNDEFHPGILAELTIPRRLSKFRLFMIRMGGKLGFADFYWNGNLKKHGAYEMRNARPYLEKE